MSNTLSNQMVNEIQYPSARRLVASLGKKLITKFLNVVQTHSNLNINVSGKIPN